MPRLSVLLAVYNTEKYVGEAIRSILGQTFTDFELLIADDGSSDQSKAEIARFNDPRIKISHNDKNQGKVRTVNRLLEMATGEYFTVHDADDISMKERFDKQIKFLDQHPDIAMCGTFFREIDEDGTFLQNVLLETEWDKIRVAIENESQFHGPTVMVKLNIPAAVGGFYRDFFIVAEDIEFYMRVCEKFKAVNLPEYLYEYRIVRTSLTKDWRNYRPERFALVNLMNYLSGERKKNGFDSYMSGDLAKVNEMYTYFVKEWETKWDSIYEQGIGRSIYFKFWKLAYSLSLKWIFKQPLKLTPYKTLLYVFRKQIGNMFD